MADDGWVYRHALRPGSDGDVVPIRDVRRDRSRSRTSLAPDCSAVAHQHDERASRFVLREFPSMARRATVGIHPPRRLRHLTLGLRYVVAVGRDGEVLSARGVLSRATLGGGDRVTSLALSPDESHVAVATRRGALHCWRLAHDPG